ncbi:hypothetical protein DOY81_012744 [Sarcophaga bullata]|nr:hypothetical protein DOY81_012744 [Sarcophaga bullata]
MKCLDSFSLSLILAIITLIACILRASFLITVLIETTKPKSDVDPIVNIFLGLNTVAYLILALFTIPLIYGIVKKLHKLMLPWLIAAAANLLFEVVFVIYSLVNGYSATILYVLISTGLGIWILYVIFMFFKAIRLANELRASNHLYTYRAGLSTLQVF